MVLAEWWLCDCQCDRDVVRGLHMAIHACKGRRPVCGATGARAAGWCHQPRIVSPHQAHAPNSDTPTARRSWKPHHAAQHITQVARPALHCPFHHCAERVAPFRWRRSLPHPCRNTHTHTHTQQSDWRSLLYTRALRIHGARRSTTTPDAPPPPHQHHCTLIMLVGCQRMRAAQTLYSPTTTGRQRAGSGGQRACMRVTAHQRSAPHAVRGATPPAG
jgi:hypothetical protein